MKVFKVVFARNEVVLCKESTVKLPNGLEIRHEQNNGQLIYAYLSANDIPEAITKVKELIPQLSTQTVQPPLTDPTVGG